MKKAKLIALTMVVALMMVGAGYAAWTDTLVVQGVVDTGRLDVKFVDLGNKFEVVTTDNNINGSIEYYNIGNELMNKAVITVNEVYPGSSFQINLKIRNNSTMPVKLDAASVNQIVSAWTWLDPHVDYTMKLNDGTSINPISTAIPKNEDLNINFAVTVPLSLNETTLEEDNTVTATITPKFVQFNAQ